MTDTGPIKPPKLYAIPAGSRGEKCKGCPAAIYKVLGAAGKVLPLRADDSFRYNGRDVSVPGARHPTEMVAGAGFNHFADCPARNDFRRRDK